MSRQQNVKQNRVEIQAHATSTRSRFALVTALFFSACCISVAQAGEIFFDKLKLGAADRASLDAFYQNVESRLPPLMKDRLPKPIEVIFEKYDSSKNIQELPLPPCTVDETKVSGLAHTIYGNGFPKTFEQGLDSKIGMNELFLKEIYKGEAQARAYDCGHRNSYRLAEATLIHEASHIYDSFRFFQSNDEKRAFMKCRAQRRQVNPRNRGPMLHVSGDCFHLIKLEGSVSDRFAYLYLNNWSDRNDEKNTKYARSPDPYEYTSAKESFAVNMEFFLLDSEYACRRPALNGYLEEYFGFKPFASSCKVPSLVGFDSRPEELNLDPSRVYQVQYLMADPGSDFSSGWGHSMIRLVMCGPNHPIPGPECLQDVPYHVVLSFRANVQDLVLSTWKGLTGKYPSEMYVLALSEVIEEYTQNEMRSITSYPVVMNDEEKKRFVEHTLEIYWEYRGRYFFITENCAEESFDMFAAAIHDIKFQADSIMTPTGLLETLQRHNRVGPMPAPSDDEYKYYHFGSFADKIDKAGNKLGSIFPSFTDKVRDKYLSDMSAADREAMFNDFAAKTQAADKKRAVAANFYILEDQRFRNDSTKLQNELFKNIAAFSEDPKKAEKYGIDPKIISDLTEKSQLIRLKNNVKKGYGIPQESDYDLEQVRKDRDAAYKWMLDQHPAIQKVIEMTEPKLNIQVNQSHEFKKRLLAAMMTKPTTRPTTAPSTQPTTQPTNGPKL